MNPPPALACNTLQRIPVICDSYRASFREFLLLVFLGPNLEQLAGQYMQHNAMMKQLSTIEPPDLEIQKASLISKTCESGASRPSCHVHMRDTGTQLLVLHCYSIYSQGQAGYELWGWSWHTKGINLPTCSHFEKLSVQGFEALCCSLGEPEALVTTPRSSQEVPHLITQARLGHRPDVAP